MKILFITHDTSRTGAPMVLLHFLRWLKQNKPEVRIDLLALSEGAMHQDFINTTDNFFDFKKLLKKNNLSFFQRILKKLNLFSETNKERALLQNLAKKGYDIVYANTIVTLPISRKIIQQNINIRLVAHIHELDVIIKQVLPNISDYIPYIHTVIAPSKLVADSLIDNWSFPSTIIHTVHACATNQKTAINPSVPKSTFTIGASGFVHWRKGYDIFIQLARYLTKTYKVTDIDFIWVGKMDNAMKAIVEEDLRKLGLQKQVRFIGEVPEPVEYYKIFDVFMMTSREDPFPLVCIEVGQLGTPIISFDQATGSNEIIEKGGGFIVPYLDVEAMAEKVMVYYNDSNLKATHGAINKEEFSKFTPAIICPQIFSIIEELL